MSLWRFLKYNNAVPITVSLLLLSFGTTLAASPEIRGEVSDSLIQKESEVVSVDNTYIAGKDLESYTPRVEIVKVTEDDTSYYVDYTIRTIGLRDDVWQDVVQGETLTVSKESLEGVGLGTYATRELKQRVDREKALLIEVQALERKVVSQRVVSTTYSGLIGTFIDDTTEVEPPYVPTEETSGVTQTPSPNAPVPEISISGGAGAPRLQILGNNPAKLALGEVYNDLGVLVTDDSGADLGYKTLLDGKEVRQIYLPPTQHATYVITYEASDASGNVGRATRTVIVGNGGSESVPQAGETNPAPAP